MAGAAALMLGHGGAASAAEIAGTPRIIDGATLEVAGRRITLFGIAAPDLDQVCRHGGRDYPCGRVARAALWDLIAGHDVSCEPVAGASAPDGPTAAICTAGDLGLNENMIATGWALADRAATDRYVATEAAAKEARRGLWKGEFEPPRQRRRTPAADAAGTGAASPAE